MNEELIRAAYEALLGREPESDDVVRSKSQGASSSLDVLRSFIGCEEYRTKTFSDLMSDGLSVKAQPVDVRVPDHVLELLFARTRRQWETLGMEDPYWSVLTHEKFRKQEIKKNFEEFDQLGRIDTERMDCAFSRAAMSFPEGVCLELGCGVGRITRHLAPRFDQVLALDISEGNLRICKKYLASCGINNVEFIHLQSVNDLTALPQIDFLFSLIVLQHNPPPVIKFFLDTTLRRVRPGGAAYFQVPTHLPNYSFNVDAYLSSEEAMIDMHSIPMFEVFESLASATFQVREILMDTSIGTYGSHKFLATRS